MPGFQPFAGVRYATADGDLSAVVAPPYDVISPDDRACLVDQSEHNAVLVELPDSYDEAARLFASWRDSGVLVTDDAPSFYAYRMTFTDDAGDRRQTLGVLGALELSRPGEAGILPHERTTSKDKADRLNLIRATRANLSPIWGLSLASGLSDLIDVSADPDAKATDEDGNLHELWRLSDTAAIADAVAGAPLVIADGHHRYEVGLAFRDEDGSDGAKHIMCLVVELNDEQLAVGPIHRLITAPGVDFPAALEPFFELAAVTAAPRSGSMALITQDGIWKLMPRRSTIDAAEADLDSARLDVALAAIPGAEVRFQHGIDLVTAAVNKGEADAAVLLRPATVEQIAATGHGGERMPPKTTFFFPKPRTGMVFRALDG